MHDCVLYNVLSLICWIIYTLYCVHVKIINNGKGSNVVHLHQVEFFQNLGLLITLKDNRLHTERKQHHTTVIYTRSPWLYYASPISSSNDCEALGVSVSYTWGETGDIIQTGEERVCSFPGFQSWLFLLAVWIPHFILQVSLWMDTGESSVDVPIYGGKHRPQENRHPYILHGWKA